MSDHHASSSGKKSRSEVARFVLDNSLLLILGAVCALLWANLHQGSYSSFVHFSIWPDMPFAKDHGLKHGLDIHFLVNDVLMALFFAIAAKEVWEALLPGGPLSNPRRAAVPLICAAGGMAGPALIFIAGALALNQQALVRGWAVPCATDIAFSYLIARIIFRPGHPAIAFLLMLAIADDAGGLIILAIAYPQGQLHPAAFLLTGGAIVMAIGMQKLRLHSFWWYLLGPGVLSWISFYIAGIHAALGIVPIIPFLPHAHTDLGIFARAEKNRHDTLNEFEHFWKHPVEFVLGFFALANAGVAFSSVGSGTVLVLAGLIIGKPLGITLFALFGEKVLRLQLPPGMRYRHVISVGLVAAIGFTVALFVATAAFKDPAMRETLDQVKMGALASISAAVIAIVVARMLGVRRDEEPVQPESDAPDKGAGDKGSDKEAAE